MPFSDDYGKACTIRDPVIDAVIPKEQRDDIRIVLRGVNLGLIASKDKMYVSREGTELLEMYIRYLERKIYRIMNLKDSKVTTFKYINIECPRCEGVRYVIGKRTKGRNVQAEKCMKCNGKGTIQKRVEENE